MSQEINEEQRYIEEVGIFFDNLGVGRTPGRIIGALMINSPPFLTMNELASTLQMSKASISTGLQMLTTMGFVSSFSIPGERADYYEINSEFWIETVRSKFKTIGIFKKLIADALELLGDDDHEERKKTLEEMKAMYAYFEEIFPKILEDWEKIRMERFGN